MIKESFIALYVIVYIFGIGFNPSDSELSNKTRDKREVSKLSDKTFKKEKISVSSFDRFSNRLFTRTWPKLVFAVY